MEPQEEVARGVRDEVKVKVEPEMGISGGGAAESEAKVEVDEAGAVKEGLDVAPVASEVKVEGGEGSVADGGVKEEEGECLVGCYVGRGTAGQGGILLGKVAMYDCDDGAYSLVFEDGQSEKVGLLQLREFLRAGESGASGMKMSCRKRKLDLLVSLEGCSPDVKGPPSTRQRVAGCEESAGADASWQSRSGSDISDDAESSSNSSDSTKELAAEPSPLVQGPELPPSSGDIAVPEESMSYLFSVYNFLRSFSVQLFLSPFGLDDFVGSLNCTVQNTLLDAIHVSLMRALKRHLEASSSEGSELSSKCLKYLDWTLLDALTWPAFLLEYLYVMGFIKDLGGKSFGTSLSTSEYYKLPVSMKLRILQILCDHVIDSDEVKTELEAREGYNEEMEYGVDPSLLSENGARAFLNRTSKSSACKKIEDLQMLETTANVTNPEAVVADASQDGNSDDCRICGMDGTLVCCDGCPWAYHSRCIGLNKASLPQGLWYCPECAVNKLGLTSSRIQRGARGAEIFGVDMCGRLFLGSCNYLLVIGTSSNAEPYSRYYNQYDVVKVLQKLTCSDAYAGICRRIMEYWGNLFARFHAEKSELGKGAGAYHTPQYDPLPSISQMKGGEGSGGIMLGNGRDSKTVVISQTNGPYGPVAKQFTPYSAELAERLEEQKCTMTSNRTGTENNTEVCSQTLLAQSNVQNVSRNAAFGVTGISSIVHQNLREQLASGSMVTGMSNSNIIQAPPAHRLLASDLSACGSAIGNGMSREDKVSTIRSAKADSYGPSYESKLPLQLIAEKFGNMSGGKPTKVSSFKPQAYVNLYIHGDVAASAAANLAVLTSDEGKVSVSHLASNPRKKMAADCALQIKAFSSAAAQFVWPSTEKKFMEVPRERCGWCLACKSTAIGTKKGCFLNSATANAIKGSARHLSAIRLIKSSETHLPSIVAYLAHMEESLRGLLVGPLQDMQYRQRWHKQLREASNCRTLRPLLLELESNIRGVAFSGSWFKLIDDWPVESSGASGGASRATANQKRGTSGRRGRKRSLAPESATTANDDNGQKEVNWWRGGKISKSVLQRGVLLSSIVRKAARQGGIKRISGLSYPEISDFPRRTRQFAWRASVGLSRNASQLALQVRYLDAHIRWREFTPPDQIPSDGKGVDAEFSAFRNAVVSDKKIVDNKIRYALKFSNQKHLPVRVTKTILEAEDNQDANGKLWFSENHVPLYLVREFEEKVGVNSLPSPGIPSSNCFTNFHQRRVKASNGDVFSYLFHKGDVFPCASCKKDVPFWDAVKCSSCQGNCHEGCISRSVSNKGGNAASDLICKLCLQKRSLLLTNYNTNAHYLLPQQKNNGQQPVTARKIVFKVGSEHSAQPVAKVVHQPVAKVETRAVTNVEAPQVIKVQAQPGTKVPSPNSEKKRKRKKTQEITYFGLVWKKNKNDRNGDGDDFRANDVILKSKDGIGSPIKPTCCLCNKDYRPDLLYIRCERCRNWFHGDALQLEESQIIELVSYRCCRCRRRTIPKCPYSDNYKKPEPEPISEETAVATSSQSAILSSEEAFGTSGQDPLVASFGRVEAIGEEIIDADLSTNMATFMPGSNQKLSVRRAQVRNGEYLDQASVPENEYYLQNQRTANSNFNFSDTNEFSVSEADCVDASELLGWDFTQGNAYGIPPTDDTTNCQWNDPSYGNFANEEYEPQTYFSFTELLAAEDTQLDNTFGMSTGLQDDGNCTGNFDQQGISFDETTRIVEDGSSNMHIPTNEPSSDGVACHKCKLYQPPPDLKCEACGLQIHTYCSPWEEREQPAGSATWRCGACREWR